MRLPLCEQYSHVQPAAHKLSELFLRSGLPLAGEDDYEQVEKGRVKAEVEGEEAGKME